MYPLILIAGLVAVIAILPAFLSRPRRHPAPTDARNCKPITNQSPAHLDDSVEPYWRRYYSDER